MEYVSHRITKSGHISIREKIDGKIHGRTIYVNQPIPSEYKEQIESDPNFEKYRTEENADKYEAKLKELEPSKEELEEQEARRQLQEKRVQVKSELEGSQPPQSNPELAKRVEKLEFVIGIRDSYEE